MDQPFNLASNPSPSNVERYKQNVMDCVNEDIDELMNNAILKTAQVLRYQQPSIHETLSLVQDVITLVDVLRSKVDANAIELSGIWSYEIVHKIAEMTHEIDALKVRNILGTPHLRAQFQSEEAIYDSLLVVGTPVQVVNDAMVIAGI